MEFILRSMIFLLIFSYFFCLGKAVDCGGNNIVSTITVGQNNNAQFNTVQAAIDSIPGMNDKWIKIHIQAGEYVEKVTIPQEKPCIILEGEGGQSTIISFNDHQTNTVTSTTSTSSTYTSEPPNVLVTDVGFKNSYNVKQIYKSDNEGNPPIKPAVAARVYGDKCLFLRCSFIGYQDTLFDTMGRHYFKDCYIQGEVDFIFGNGQSYYENCSINAMGMHPNIAGFITAQGRNAPNETTGFVFEGGSIIGNGPINLGRAWRPYSRVIFHRTNFASIITPKGWDAWSYGGHERNFTYAEVDCEGAGSDTSQRVPWLTKLNDSQLQQFSLESFINYDKWLDYLPIKF